MLKDPIIEELHKIREEHAANFNYDLDAIFADILAEQERSAARMVSRPAKRIKKTKATIFKRAV